MFPSQNLAAAAVMFGMLLGVSACATQNSAAQSSGAKSYTVPTNYRQLVARRILETVDRQKIGAAHISRPHDQWMGIVHGGTRSVICVELFRETIMFSNARDIWVFTFEDGRIASSGYANFECRNTSPFREIVRRK